MTRRNFTLRVKLTREELDLLRAHSLKTGYATLSAYVRHATLYRDALLHDRLHDVLKHLQSR